MDFKDDIDKISQLELQKCQKKQFSDHRLKQTSNPCEEVAAS